MTCPTTCITNLVTKFTTTIHILPVTFKTTTTNPITKNVTATSLITFKMPKISTLLPKTTTSSTTITATAPVTSVSMPKTTTTTTTTISKTSKKTSSTTSTPKQPKTMLKITTIITTKPKTIVTMPKFNASIGSVTSVMTTVTTPYQKTTPITSYTATTITTTKLVVTTFEEKTSNTKAITNPCEYNCNRPISWITTASTTNTLRASYNEKKSYSDERNEPTSISNPFTQPSTTANIITETNTDAEAQQTTDNKLTLHTNANVSKNIRTHASAPPPPTTINNTTKLSSINTISKESESKYNNLIDISPDSVTTDSDSALKSITPEIDKLTFKLDTTTCDNCRRPKTWITRIKTTKRLKHHGHRY